MSLPVSFVMQYTHDDHALAMFMDVPAQALTREELLAIVAYQQAQMRIIVANNMRAIDVLTGRG